MTGTHLDHRKDDDSSHFKFHGGDNPTSTSLLIRLKNGEPVAWENFMDLYVPLIQFWCRKAKDKLDRPDRQDILQEVLRKVHKSIGKFDHAKEGRYFRAWLRKITENTIIDHLNEREKKKDISQLYSDTGHIKAPIRPPEPIPSDIDFELTEEPNEKIVLLKQVLKTIRSSFSDQSWDVFNLLVIAEKPSIEVAAQMNLKPDSVRKVRSRILKRIYAEYEKLGLGDELPDSIAPLDE